MMEGVVSLMQMAKISTALAQLDDAQGAVHLCAHRPHHRRRYRQLRHARRSQHCRTWRPHRLRRPARHRTDDPAKLPEGFQRSEFLLEKGFLDAVVHRHQLKNYLVRALQFMKVPEMTAAK